MRSVSRVWLILFLALAGPPIARAGYVSATLGTAGPSNYGILALGSGGSLLANGSTVVGVKNIQISGSNVTGNIGIARSGAAFQLANSTIYGSVSLASGAVIQNSGGTISGSVLQNQGTVLNQATTDAINAANTFGQLLATMSVGSQILGSQTIIGGAGVNVLNISNLVLTAGATLTLSAPVGGQFVINDTGGYILMGGSIVLAGGLTASDVVINVLGTGGIVQVGGDFNGILLNAAGAGALIGGRINGQVIVGGETLALADDTVTHAAPAGPEVAPVAPAPPSLALISTRNNHVTIWGLAPRQSP